MLEPHIKDAPFVFTLTVFSPVHSEKQPFPMYSPTVISTDLSVLQPEYALSSR